MSECPKKGRAATARGPSYLVPFVGGLLWVACAQSPHEQEPRAKPAGAIAPIHDDRSSFGAPPSEGSEAEPGFAERGEEVAPDPAPDSTERPALASDDDDSDDDGPAEAEPSADTIDDLDPVSRSPAGIEATEITGQADRDKDGLVDRYETKTGIFVDAMDTGTDPDDPDTDDDGLSDGDEVLGTIGQLDLPAMGVSPVHRDLLLEYDWIDDSDECGPHTHEPKATSLAMVTSAFADAPIENPDGVNGINLIHDYGQGGLFMGGTKIEASTLIEGGATGAEFQKYKAQNMAPNRVGYFHYVLMAHRYRSVDAAGKVDLASGGNGELPGTGFMVTLYCANSEGNVASTVMHELGHNLGLRHGGDENRNKKPNYNSIMNYVYQFPGIDTDCAPGGDGRLDYSRNTLATLQETALYEPAGICNNVWWDWNKNGKVDTASVKADVNGDGQWTELHDFDDWASIGRRKSLVRIAVVDDSEPPPCPPPPESNSSTP